MLKLLRYACGLWRLTSGDFLQRRINSRDIVQNTARGCIMLDTLLLLDDLLAVNVFAVQTSPYIRWRSRAGLSDSFLILFVPVYN